MIVRHSGPYTLAKYEITDDLHDPEVRRKRGLITDNTGKVVCYGLDKFFNWNEPYADPIDWSHPVVVTEKIDGTCIRLWHDCGTWHMSTLGTIAAEQGGPDGCGSTWLELTVAAVGGQDHYAELVAALDPEFTYWFELTGPQNRVVVDYAAQLWYLGRRSMRDWQEDFARQELPHVAYPAVHEFASLDEAVASASTLDGHHEGYVVRDIHGHRVKVKGKVYLEKAKLIGNGPLTKRRAVELWQANQLDDFVAAAPSQRKAVERFAGLLAQLANRMEAEYERVASVARQDVARLANPKYASYIFAKRSNKVASAVEFLQGLRENATLALIYGEEDSDADA